MDDECNTPDHEASHSAMTVETTTIPEGKIMSDGMQDKVDVHNIFKPGHGESGGGMGGLGTAAVIAAMGNRNEGGGLASCLPLLMGHHRPDGLAGGFGAGLVGGLLGGILFGGRGGRGGIFGGGEDCGNNGAETRIEDTVFNTAILQKLGSIEAAIPLAAAGTENTILQQTIDINGSLSSLALGTQQGFSNTKDAVQNTSAVTLGAISGVKDSVTNVGTILLQGLNTVNQNVSEQSCEVQRVVVGDGEKTRALLTARFQLEDSTKINELNARVIELQSEGRRHADNADLKLSITNTNTAIAAQAQGQQQQQQQAQGFAINELLHTMQGLVQVAHATNQNVIAGNTGAVTTGAQAANPVNVAT